MSPLEWTQWNTTQPSDALQNRTEQKKNSILNERLLMREADANVCGQCWFTVNSIALARFYMHQWSNLLLPLCKSAGTNFQKEKKVQICPACARLCGVCRKTESAFLSMSDIFIQPNRPKFIYCFRSEWKVISKNLSSLFGFIGFLEMVRFK